MMRALSDKEVLMKKPARMAFLSAAVLAVFVFLLAETVVVKIKTTSVRRDPKFTSAAVAALKAGEPLEKIEARNGWFKVKTKAGVVGWIHSTAVEAKKVDLLAMDKSMKTQASAGEVALAAKGFNKQVEDKYRAGNPAANFAAVDALEKVKPTAAEVEAFLKQGKLGEYGGAR
jgi:SH3-like domain-containing protein